MVAWGGSPGFLYAYVGSFLHGREQGAALGLTHGLSGVEGRIVGLCGAPYDAYVMTDFGDVFARYKACILIEPTETARSIEAAERAAATDMPVLRIQDDSTSAAELQRKLIDLGVDVPVRRTAVVYRSKNYISLYTSEEGEYDFCDRDTRRFVDLFSGEEISFPTVLPKNRFFLFKRA